MISDSAPWKRDLLAIATRLETVSKARRPSHRRLIDLEKDIFVGCYIVRKLIKAHLVSTATKDLDVPTVAYPARAKRTTLINWHKVDELFDFSKGDRRAFRLLVLCNAVIHSFVYLPIATSKSGPVKKFLIASDRQRRKSLFEVNLLDVSSAFGIVGNDYPANVQMTFNDEQGDFDVVAT